VFLCYTFIMLFELALSLATSAAAFQQSTPAVVWGQVRSDGSGAPLRYAVVEVVIAGRTRARAQTDANGYYRLDNITPGRRLFRATHYDHAPHEIEVALSPGQQINLDFGLELRPLELPPVTARATAISTGLRDTVSARAPDIGTATVRLLEATPGVAEFGLAEAVREVPGQEPVDPSDVLFVRGHAADLQLVLLNGAPVYSPFHIGGLINALDTNLLRSATLYLGGAPARYDGGLSYVMDLETRSGRQNAQHLDVGVDMLAARGITEGPIGRRVSYLLGGRAVHGMGATPFVSDPFPYTYGDGLARLDIELDGGTLSATGFWNRENVRLDSAGAVDQVAEWGNNAGSLRYRGEMLGSEALLTAAIGRFRTELPLSGLRPLVTQGESRRIRLAADFARAFGSARLFYGASFDRLRFQQTAVSLEDSVETLALSADGVGDVTGLYVDGSINASGRVRLRAGIRADVFSLSPTPRVAPRLSATFLLTDKASLTLAAGRYRQYVRVPEQAIVLLESTAEGEARPEPLTVARASHLVLAFDQNLGEGMRLGIEGFYKTFDGLPSASGGNADATGVDLWLRRSSGSITGWFGYSLAWIWAEEDERFTPTQEFSGRHLVSAGVAGPMIGGGQFDVRVAYGAGLPFTAIPEPEVTTPVFGLALHPAAEASFAAEPEPTLPSAPNQPYLRLDAQLARTWTADWRGFAFELTPYLKVLNALDRRDAIFYHYDRNEARPEPRALAALPVLPVFGVEWKF
jgi:hypothetical protein